MKTINIFKAQPIGSQIVEDVIIRFDCELPDSKKQSIEEWRIVARKEAELLDDALSNVLPQGVYDALMIRMLERKRSLFVVPMEQVKITYERMSTND